MPAGWRFARPTADLPGRPIRGSKAGLDGRKPGAASLQDALASLVYTRQRPFSLAWQQAAVGRTPILVGHGLNVCSK